MKTGQHLRIESMGDDVLGVRLTGNPRNPEPIHFRVCFPGGDLEIVRTTDGSANWVHVRINHPDDSHDPDQEFGQISRARLDIIGKNTSENAVGDFSHPGLYHLAVLVQHRPRQATPTPKAKKRQPSKDV